MNQLSKSMIEASDRFDDPEIPEVLVRSPETIDMQQAAERWAVAALRTFTGETLVKALAISKAMSEFVADLENPHGDSK